MFHTVCTVGSQSLELSHSGGPPFLASPVHPPLLPQPFLLKVDVSFGPGLNWHSSCFNQDHTGDSGGLPGMKGMGLSLLEQAGDVEVS